MTVRGYCLLLCLCSLVASAAAGVLGLSWGERISSAEGFYQVTVKEAQSAEARSPGAAGAGSRFPRPRRAFFVVLDGLGYEDSGAMRSLALLGERGQCRKTYVGSLSLSRPMYSVLSTGLEADRTGVRSNEPTPPLASESIWEVARQAGLSVTGVSELSWWQQLFPSGFATYLTPPESANYFELAVPADLMLIHTVYIDEAGHQHGAGSAEYRREIERADRELLGLFSRLDLGRDLVVVTADHGHALRGGHGGQQDRVVHVRTCYAGPAVRHLPSPPSSSSSSPWPAGDAGAPLTMDSTSIGPSLSLFLGLRFPANMRAGVGALGDNLDVLFELSEPSAFPAGYLDGRRAEIERFRAQSRLELMKWLPESEGSWPKFYTLHRKRVSQVALLSLVPMLGVLALLAHAHRRRLGRAPRREVVVSTLFALGFCLLVWGSAYAIQVTLRGSFDLTSTNHRTEFIRFTTTAGIACGIGGLFIHLTLRRSLAAAMLDLSALLVFSMIGALSHPAVLGWKQGFPLPSPELIFFPYFATLFIVALGNVGLVVSLYAFVRSVIGRRRGRGAALS